MIRRAHIRVVSRSNESDCSIESADSVRIDRYNHVLKRKSGDMATTPVCFVKQTVSLAHRLINAALLRLSHPAGTVVRHSNQLFTDSETCESLTGFQKDLCSNDAFDLPLAYRDNVSHSLRSSSENVTTCFFSLMLPSGA